MVVKSWRLALGALLFSLLTIGAASAQGTIQQSGPIVPFHGPAWYGNGVVGDGGAPSSPFLSALGLFNGPNCPVGVSSQTGPGVSTAPHSLFSICQTDAATTFNFSGVNGQAAPSVIFDIGGVNYPFPGPGNGDVQGPPSSTSSHLACFNGTSGTLLADCGAGLPLPVAYGGTGSTSPSAALTALGAVAQANNGSDFTSLPATLNNLSGLPRVANTTALEALASTAYPAVVRLGFVTAGDAAPIAFISAASACSLNSGGGDGGSQVPSADGKCWLAAFPSELDVREWGVPCTTATLNAALTFARTVQPAVVRTPQGVTCSVSSTVTIPQNVTLQGSGIYSVGLNVTVPNLTLAVSLGGNAASLLDMYIAANGGGVNTTGVTVGFAAPYSYNRINNVFVEAPCIGFDISGNTQWVWKNTARDFTGTGCTGARLGHLTTGGTTVDLAFEDNTLVSNQSSEADQDLLIQDAGGLWLLNNSLIFGKVGTLIQPGSGQFISWMTTSGNYFGDTTTVHDMVVDVSNGGELQGWVSNNDWFGQSVATYSGTGLYLGAVGSGTLDGVWLINPRVIWTGANGIDVLGGTNINFQAAHLCGVGRSGIASDINIASGVSGVTLQNSDVVAGCAGIAAGSFLSVGVTLGGSNADIIITGNRIVGPPTAISGTPTGNSNVNGNTGVDSVTPTLASAATITLPVYPSVVLSGSTAVTTMNGYWNGRIVQLYTSTGALSFNTGGNLCNAVATTAANDSVSARYDPTAGCWRMKH